MQRRRGTLGDDSDMTVKRTSPGARSIRSFESAIPVLDPISFPPPPPPPLPLLFLLLRLLLLLFFPLPSFSSFSYFFLFRLARLLFLRPCVLDPLLYNCSFDLPFDPSPLDDEKGIPLRSFRLLTISTFHYYSLLEFIPPRLQD